MHDDHPDAVFSKLGKHIGHRERREILEFVEIAVEGSTSGNVDLLPAERGKSDRGDEKAAEQGRGILSDLPLGEVHQKDFAFIHDPPDIDRLLGSSEDAIESWVSEKGPDLVLDRCDSVRAHAVRVFFIFVFPKLTHLRIFDIPNHLLAERFI